MKKTKFIAVCLGILFPFMGYSQDLKTTVDAHAVLPPKNRTIQKAQTTGETHLIRAAGLTVLLSADGEIKSLSIHGKKYEKPVFAYTTITGCRQTGATIVKKTDDNLITFERKLVHDSLQKSCVLIDKFSSTATGVRWELTVKGTGEPWGSIIQTRIRYPAGKNALFWTTWGVPQYDTSMVDISQAKRLKKYPTKTDDFYTWTDPLILLPFSDVSFDYGTQHYSYGKEWYFPFKQTFSIPIATVIEPEHRAGLTFALSPDDEIINLIMQTTAQGDIVFNRLFNRISFDHECLFSMDIITHADDWRPALAWMTHRYPEYFNPVNPQAHHLGGTGAYSGYLDDFDADKMKRMCFTVNWQASFDFPYMGMFLPPVDVNEQWDSFKGEKTSIKSMNDYAADMKKRGFYVFNYFNVTEFALVRYKICQKMSTVHSCKQSSQILIGKGKVPCSHPIEINVKAEFIFEKRSCKEEDSTCSV